jgi:hypothetical protein
MKEKENTNELNQNSEDTNLNLGEQSLTKEISSENEIKTEQTESDSAPGSKVTNKKKTAVKPVVGKPEAIKQKEEAVSTEVSQEGEEIVSEDANKSKTKKNKKKMKEKEKSKEKDKEKEKAKKKKQLAKKKEKTKEDKKKEKAKKAKQKATAKKKAKAKKAKDKAKAKKIAKKKAKKSKSKSKKKK